MLAARAALAIVAFVVPSPAPATAPSASPSASPTPLATIGRTSTNVGRATNLVGIATAASEGTIDMDQIAARPVLRPGEVLEDIPGIVISQHSGEGKANQYYLRGFQLDHGTDLAGTIAGIPVNMPTHAHGQGYSDINWLMPELVSFVTFKKGPYYAGEGDFSTAGSYELSYRDTIAPAVTLGGGDYGYDRLFLAASPKLGAGNLLAALELYHDDGPFVNPDDYKKINGVVRWSETKGNTSFNLTASAYRGDFRSSDQIPERLVGAGLLGPFGALDPSDGGQTFRYAFSAEYLHLDPNGMTRSSAFGESYGLDLFSNFTYSQFDAGDYDNVTANPQTCVAAYSTCVPGTIRTGYVSYCPANTTPANGSAAPGSVTPVPFSFGCGDQREQEDKRFVSGARFIRDIDLGHVTTLELGAGERTDNISTLGLFLTNDRVRYANGTLSNDRVLERNGFLWSQVSEHLGKLRLTAGLRYDGITDRVAAFLPQNSGKTSAAMVNPKATAAYAFTPNSELYLNFGDSYHSNDGRGTTQTVDPQTRTTIDAQGNPVQSYPPMVRAFGSEIGYRYSNGGKYTGTLTFWKLNIASELVFDGDHGVTTPNGPTLRKGIELTNFYSPSRTLTLDADVACATARFLTDPQNAGTFVPESLNVVSSAGITLNHTSYAATLRYRYFGPRVLDQAGDAVSAPSGLVDFQYVAKLSRRHNLRLDIFNVLNAPSDDVAYFYQSWLPYDARNPVNAALNPAVAGPCQAAGTCGVNDYHVHPSNPRTIRLSYTLTK